jgi:hypothetical protein
VRKQGKIPLARAEEERIMATNAVEWMRAWRSAEVELERVRREALRAIDGRKALALLTVPADYRAEPRKPRPSSGLIEQQRWFRRARGDA